MNYHWRHANVVGELGGLTVALIKLTIVLFFIGVLTVKALAWGGAATATLWLGAPLVRTFTRTDLLGTMGPKFEGLLLFYPQVVVDLTFASFATHVGGWLGVVLAVLIVACGVVPYGFGLLVGLLAWPELLLLRLVV